MRQSYTTNNAIITRNAPVFCMLMLSVNHRQYVDIAKDTDQMRVYKTLFYKAQLQWTAKHPCVDRPAPYLARLLAKSLEATTFSYLII